MRGKMADAIVSVLFTILFAVLGILTYLPGDGRMFFFGIELSQAAFAVIICVLIVWDVIAIVIAVLSAKKEKGARTAREEALRLFLAAEMERVETAERLPAVCKIKLKRKRNILTDTTVKELKVGLNGVQKTTVRPGKTVHLFTTIADNCLALGDGWEAPFRFTAVPDGEARLLLTERFGRFKVKAEGQP